MSISWIIWTTIFVIGFAVALYFAIEGEGDDIFAIVMSVITGLILIILLLNKKVIVLGLAIGFIIGLIVMKILNRISRKRMRDDDLKSEALNVIVKNDNVSNLPKQLTSSESKEIKDALQDIKEMQEFITSNLKELEEKIDNSYGEIARTISNMGDLVVNIAGKSMSEDTKCGISVGATLVSGAVNLYGKYKAEKEKRELERKLLIKKQELAKVRVPILDKYMPQMFEKLTKQIQILKKYTNVSYNISDFNDGKIELGLLCGNMDKILAICRVMSYYCITANSLHKMYKEWLYGDDKADVYNPSMYAVNKYLIDMIFKSKDVKVDFKNCLNMPASKNDIEGTSLLMLNDCQLLAIAILDSGGQEFKKEFVASNDVVNKLLSSNETYVGYKKRYDNYYYRLNKGVVKIPKIIYWCLPIVAAYSYAYFNFLMDIMEVWAFVYILLCIIIGFVAAWLINRGNRKEWFYSAIEKIEKNNSMVLYKMAGR